MMFMWLVFIEFVSKTWFRQYGEDKIGAVACVQFLLSSELISLVFVFLSVSCHDLYGLYKVSIVLPAHQETNFGSVIGHVSFNHFHVLEFRLVPIVKLMSFMLLRRLMLWNFTSRLTFESKVKNRELESRMQLLLCLLVVKDSTFYYCLLKIWVVHG